MKVLPLHCKRLGSDDHIKWRTVSSWRHKNSVPNLYFRTKYTGTQIKILLLFFFNFILNKKCALLTCDHLQLGCKAASSVCG